MSYIKFIAVSVAYTLSFNKIELQLNEIYNALFTLCYKSSFILWTDLILFFNHLIIEHLRAYVIYTSTYKKVLWLRGKK